jgi:hypothetical protein
MVPKKSEGVVSVHRYAPHSIDPCCGEPELPAAQTRFEKANHAFCVVSIVVCANQNIDTISLREPAEQLRQSAPRSSPVYEDPEAVVGLRVKRITLSHGKSDEFHLGSSECASNSASE